ncbi:MAG: hypothetical protein HRU19_27165 [Pseudobacteriovorax sp.]|nr:hypothetical protein [Pseudobacteriovorax sp.]
MKQILKLTLSLSLLSQANCNSDNLNDTKFTGSDQFNREAALNEIQVENLLETGDIPGTLGSCLSAMENLEDFKVGDALDYRIIEAIVPNNIEEIEIEDAQTTETPEIVLIKIPGENAGEIEVSLGNPNGLYCVEVAMTSVEEVEIESFCNAQVLKTELNSASIGEFEYETVPSSDCDLDTVNNEDEEENEDDDNEEEDQDDDKAEEESDSIE